MTTFVEFFDSVGFNDDPATMLTQLSSYGINIFMDDMDPVNNDSDLNRLKHLVVASYPTKLQEIKNAMHVDYVDEFIELTACWGVTGSVQIIEGVGGQLEMATGTVINDTTSLNFVLRSLRLDCKFDVSYRLKMEYPTNVILEFGAYDDSDNLTRFIYDSSASSNWIAENKLNGNSTTTEVSAVNTNWHTYKIESSGSSLRYYIDQTLVTTHTTNLPTTLMRMYIKQTTLTNASKTTIVDFVKHSTLRLT